jgi:RNA recognition motif-containing protein
MSMKVFVGNLDYGVTRTQMLDLFQQAGPVRDVFLPTDRETGKPRGFAFVEFESDADGKAAIERFNGYQLKGRAMDVKSASDRK